MSTEIAVREEGRQMAVLTNEQLQYIADTEFVPPGLRGNLPAILACVATGRALGIADMSALRSIHIIDGKATFSAELMVQLVRRAGHSIVGEVTDGAATVTGTRGDNGDTMKCTWTLAMAERAGLLNKSNWKKYPEAMLWARAASQLCRMLFADCFAGGTYTPEELDGDVLAGEPQMAEVVSDVPLTDEQPSPAEPTPSAQKTELAGETFEDIFEESHTSGERPNKATLTKLNILVVTLRDAEKITTQQLYHSVGLMRDVDPDDLARALPDAIDDEGVLHWGPLSKTLSKAEASYLIDRLSKLQGHMAAAK